VAVAAHFGGAVQVSGAKHALIGSALPAVQLPWMQPAGGGIGDVPSMGRSCKEPGPAFALRLRALAIDQAVNKYYPLLDTRSIAGSLVVLRQGLSHAVPQRVGAETHSIAHRGVRFGPDRSLDAPDRWTPGLGDADAVSASVAVLCMSADSGAVPYIESSDIPVRVMLKPFTSEDLYHAMRDAITRATDLSAIAEAEIVKAHAGLSKLALALEASRTIRVQTVDLVVAARGAAAGCRRAKLMVGACIYR
jgi:hypothetical protein